MQLISLLFGAVTFIAAGALAFLAPDLLARVILVAMFALLVPGYYLGIFRVWRMGIGFNNGRKAIRQTVQEHPGSVWLSLQEKQNIFRHKSMDAEFRDYAERTERHMQNGQLADDVEDVFNADAARLKSRRNVVEQISGSLTGLGLLGTFLGLITGINGIGFSSVEATVSSIQTLLGGIETAFYTSIAGVILSILYNLFQNFAWNVMENEMGLFIRDFHLFVLPCTVEMERRLNRREMHQILKYLEQMTVRESFSLGKPGNTEGTDNGQILMPQIMSGLRNNEFIIYILPCYDLSTRKIQSGEALVRWNHGKMGMVEPGIFLPILEKNGAIVQLDKYVWEKVGQLIRSWIDQKQKVVPVVVNVSRTDLLSTDVVTFFRELVQKYDILPKNIEVDIALDAYVQAYDFTLDVQRKLQQLGFRTNIDGFDGNFVALSQSGEVTADAMKLDLRQLDKNNDKGLTIPAIYAYAKAKGIHMIANGIQTMDQLSQLRKNGCTTGQGYFFCKPVPSDEFERMLKE